MCVGVKALMTDQQVPYPLAISPVPKTRNILIFIYFLIYMIFYLHVYLYTTYVLAFQGVQKRALDPEITDTMWVLGIKLDPLEEKPVL